MADERDTAPLREYAYALFLAISITALIALLTNTTPPKWDATFYVNMAEHGIMGNPNLVAPYAYRLGVPFLCRALSGFLSLPMEDCFRIIGWISAVGFLMGIFAVSRLFTTDYRHAFAPMILLGFSYVHIKFPLFFPTLIDVTAYALITLAFWAFLTKRLVLCLLVSCIGMLFKEFLVVPLILLIVQLSIEFRRSRSGTDLWRLVVAVILGAGVIVIPRLYIPIIGTNQFIDPINNPSSLKRLFLIPMDEFRVFNIIYATVSYWLPTMLLLTRSRFAFIWEDLRSRGLLWAIGGWLFLVFLLTMYGGTNITVFTGYAAVVQVIALTLLFRRGIGLAETIFAIYVVFMYNKIPFHIPLPTVNVDAYIDFYGGWSSRVSITTLTRFLECGAFIAIAAAIRVITSMMSSSSACEVAEDSE